MWAASITKAKSNIGRARNSTAAGLAQFLEWREPELSARGIPNANPITYLSGGEQHVAIASGNSIFAFALE